jgi:hypothetical protein
METARTKVPEIKRRFNKPHGPNDPHTRVEEWAGATPVWAPLARPDPLACCRRSGVAPAHSFEVLTGQIPGERITDGIVHTEAN